MSQGSRDAGGTLTVVLSADPPGLDPVQLQGVQNWAEAVSVACVFDALFMSDEAGRVCPKIGESLRSDDGGRSWLLKLRSGVRFSDGTALDAEAVRFNWERLADPANRSPVAGHAAQIAAMEVVDTLRLQVSLRTANPNWDMVVQRYFATIGSPKAIRDKGNAFVGEPVGAGPFLLAEWERGSRTRFVRNPDYWQSGKPRFDEIVVLTGLNEAADKFAAMVGGRAQVALEPLGGNIPKYREQDERFALLSTPEAGGGVALAMNVRRAPLSDRRVRKALSLVLGSAEFVAKVGYGDDTMAMTTIDREGSDWCDPSLRLPPIDVPAAQGLIDTVVAESGAPVRFSVETFPNEGHVREANAIKEMIETKLRDVEVQVTVGSVADLAGRWRTGEYDATNFAVRWATPQLDLPGAFASGAGMNIMGYANEAVDAALSKLATTADRREAVALHRQVLRQVLEDLPVIWLSHKEAFHVVDTRAVQDWSVFYSLRPLVEEARPAG